MNPYLWFIIPVAVIVLVVVILRRDKGAVSFLDNEGVHDQTNILDGQRTTERLSERPSKTPRETHRAGAYHPSDEVIGFVQRGMNILAIKQVREETGLGLKEAKDIVDALVAGIPPRPPWDGEVSEQVRRLYAEGKKIQAIKVLRAESGLGLKEAKDLVEGL